MRNNHKWTEEEREFVRVHYAQTHASRDRIAEYLGVTPEAVAGQVSAMGLSKRTGRRPWNAEEDKQLRELTSQHCPRKVGQMMHRSLNSIVLRMKRLGILRRQHPGWYTKKEVCEILGVDHKRVQYWIDHHALKASWYYDRKPQKEGMSAWQFTPETLVAFITTYPEQLNGRNVDLITIVALLAGLKGCKHHWVLPTNGKTVEAVCRICGEEKVLLNIYEDTVGFNNHKKKSIAIDC